MNTMLPEITRVLVNDMVAPLLRKESAVLDESLRRAAEKALQSGIGGSGMANFGRIRVYFQHYQSLAEDVWNVMKRVLGEAGVEASASLADDLKNIFDGFLRGPAERIGQSLHALKLARQQMPKETFEAVQADVRHKYHSEISLFCAALAADAKRKTKEPMNVIYNLHGDNPRVNIDSKDYSINIKNSESIFRELTKAVTEVVSEKTLRDQLVGKVKEMETSVKDKPNFLRAYSEFIALAANHMTVLGPFIPALTQFISK